MVQTPSFGFRVKPWFANVTKALRKEPKWFLHDWSLRYFQQVTRAAHAFQTVVDLPYVDADCFSHSEPVVVPARTLLSQLL